MFAAFLAVLIAIEIFANITLYLRDEVIHVKLVIATALMAIARKVIVLDFSELARDETGPRTSSLAFLQVNAVWLCFLFFLFMTMAFGAIGFCGGLAGPSRDILVRRVAASRFGASAYGRIYGMVYSGLDAGLAISPLVFGPMMDAAAFTTVLATVAVLQLLAVAAAVSASRFGARAARQPAT
ncbi:phosphate-starvation-inducible PsiE family protein [Rhodocyclaceae bacterium SMB388]